MTKVDFPRPLSDREREVMVAMLTYASADDEDQQSTLTSEWRSQILENLNLVTVASTCDCGTCPTINLPFDGHPKLRPNLATSPLWHRPKTCTFCFSSGTTNPSA
ncbi:hypothetical protein [Boudabousia liubingyangii]|uniref:hypothetical protein n=1 Tax=Boudabousia liubingyangii TaxID=1921764 RepID=UPI0011785CA0|nr:hypothetical protein [Boudabousia liubingyangii]